MKLKKFLSITILSVLIYLCFVYYVTVFIFIEDWLGLQSSAGSLNFLIFTFLAFLCAFSFLVCVFTDPGGVPSSYAPDVEENQISDQETKKTGVYQTRCDKCSTYRPPRAHHCRICRRCVLKMDHHCVWINNCVGHRNYKSFILLVFYATLASTYSAIMIISCALQKDWDYNGKLPLKIFHVCFGCMIVGMSLTFGTFLCWHIYLTAHNMTTIEYYEGKRAAWLARKSGLSYHHIFDVGVYKNITLVSLALALQCLRSKHAEMAVAHFSKSSQRWTYLSNYTRYFVTRVGPQKLLKQLVFIWSVVQISLFSTLTGIGCRTLK